MGKKEYLVLAGILALGVVNAFWMLPAATLEDHECFVSVTAREMLASGNWVLPTMNGQPRINKTPLCYWLVAGLGKITGRINEFTTRLPSAVFAVLSAVIIFYFVYQWLGFRIAALSGAVWTTSLAYVRCSHIGRPDMPVAFFITLCLLSFYSFVTSESRGRQIFYALVFWISFGLGNLAKGPAPLPLVLLPLFFYIAFNRKWSVLPKMTPVLGIIIFLAILLPWPLIVAYKVNWNLVIWKKEFLDRLVGEYAPGRYPFYYYFIMMFKYITPWVVFLPVALAAPFFKACAEKRAVMKYLWLWFVVDFIFLTLDVGKRQHYILPLMPAMAILVGILLEDMVFSRKVYPPVFIRRFAIVNVLLITIAVVGGIVAAAIFWPAKLAGVAILCLFAASMTILASLLFYKRRLVAALAVCFVSVSISFMVYIWYEAAVIDDFRPVRNFASQIAKEVPQDSKLVVYGGISSTFVHYYGRVVTPVTDIEKLYQLFEQGDWILATSLEVGSLEKDGRFREVYYKAVQPELRRYATGGLFHKKEN